MFNYAILYLITTIPDPPFAPAPEVLPPPPPPRGRRRCFTDETKVLLSPDGTVIADLIERSICRIKIGDHVVNKDRTATNKVTFVEEHEPSDKDPDLFSPNENIPPFATTNHPLFVDGEWVAVDVDQYPWLGKQRPLRDANVELINGRRLLNLWVSGDGTYIVNGFGTHSIMYDGGLLKNCYNQGILTHEGVMKIMRFYMDERSDIVTGAFLFGRLMGYVNIPLLNRLSVYFLTAENHTLRKKLLHKLMGMLQKKYGVK